MPVKIRLMRIGSKKRPFYRVVSVDERKKRTGKYLELLGTYNPLTEPKEIILKKDRIDYWIKNGAVPSEGYLRIIGKAPQRPPRKPKKEKKETGNKGAEKQEETKTEEKAETETEEKPIEEVKTEQVEESTGTEVKEENPAANIETPEPETEKPEEEKTKKE